MDTGEEDDADKRKVEGINFTTCKIEVSRPRNDRDPTRKVEAVTVAKVMERG